MTAKRPAAPMEQDDEAERIWWEKSVEYAFLMRGVKAGLLKFAAPLAGLAEGAGDGVFGSGAKVILVEFKRTRGHFASEKDKYEDWVAAFEDLRPINRCHYLVYGEGKTDFQVSACPYFPELTWQNDELAAEYGSPVPGERVLGIGVSPREFLAYVALLLAYKTPDERGKVAGGLRPLTMAMGIRGTSLAALSISEYLSRVDANLLKQADENAARFKAAAVALRLARNAPEQGSAPDMQDRRGG